MARKYHAVNGHPERYELITMEGAFHGRTLATIAAGGQKKYLEGFGPAMPGFPQVPFDDLNALKEAIGPATAGILIEPIQGEGGIRPLPYGDLRQIREICDEAGILLVLDEVQTGIGRTGKLFAHELAGITPDIMAIAKALGGGFPVGACLATEEAAKGMTAEQAAEKIRDPLTFADIIEGVRGEGLMLGIKCKVPNTDLVAAARSEHLLVVGAGDNTIRLLPPLNIGDQEVEEAIDKLSNACTALDGHAGGKREGAA